MTATTLLIARHGNTFSPGDVVTRVGVTDLPLVESGLLQGRRLGLYLLQNNLVPDVIFTSTLKRALQTAEQAQQAMNTVLPIKALSIFNEIDYGIDENQPEDKVVARIGAQALSAWERNAEVPAGWNVNPQEIINNWQLFATELGEHDVGKIILVVTSNGIARFAPYLTGDFKAFSLNYGIKIATGAICRLEKKTSSQYWECLQWNIKP
jgi:2,3-bisphosphoglycerate-dependent phosphoglycerate mutase